MNPRVLSCLFVVSLLFAARPLLARESSEDFDRRISAELSARDPEAGRLFAEANAARERGDLPAAVALYEQVFARAPGFDHARRRQCGCEMQMGLRDPAVSHCREALKIEPSPENQTALAAALLSPAGEAPPPDADKLEALGLARRATEASPDSEFAALTLCEASWQSEDVDALKQCTDRGRGGRPEAAGEPLLLLPRGEARRRGYRKSGRGGALRRAPPLRQPPRAKRALLLGSSARRRGPAGREGR